jgi:predicted metal-dependent HD superfamily phosphohydrolase
MNTTKSTVNDGLERAGVNMTISDRIEFWERLICLVAPYYDQPHRHYHTTVHLNNMFGHALSLKWDLTLVEMVAIAYHDIVWVAGNDHVSVQLSSEILKAHHTSGLLDWMEDYVDAPCAYPTAVAVICNQTTLIINDTFSHTPAFTCDSTRVIDLDMIGFSVMEDQEHLREQLRNEFCMFDDSQFNAGRLAFLNTMLDRSPFYYNLGTEYNKAAISVILDEIKLLMTS